MASMCSTISSQSPKATQTSSSSTCLSSVNPNQRFYPNQPFTLGPSDGESFKQFAVTQDHLISLAETRSKAFHVLSLYHNTFASLEVTRLRKSRSGLSHWVSFWARIYHKDTVHLIIAPVAHAHPQIDQLFRAVADDLGQSMQTFESLLLKTESEREILQALEELEATVGSYRRRRREKACDILESMRSSIEGHNIIITDEAFIDMKRGIFALDAVYDYHPGDARTEAREREFPLRVWLNGGQRSLLSPAWYRDWEDRVVDDTRRAVRERGHELVCQDSDLYWVTDSEEYSGDDGEWYVHGARLGRDRW